MKKIGIAVTDPDDWTAAALRNAVKHFGMEHVTFSLSRATSNIASGKIHADNIDLTSLDAVIVRDMGPSTRGDAAFRFDLLCHLEELGIRVINPPEAIAKAANKHASSFLFQKKGILTPGTVATSDLDEALSALSSFGDAVVKPVFGYKGIGIERLKNDGSGARRLKELLDKDGMVYLQEFIPNPGRDIRVFIVDNKVAGAIYRIAPAGGWINNLSQGGCSKPCSLTEEQKNLGLKASEAIGTVYAGVDIIEGDRDYVIEINGTPSGKGIFEACGVDVTRDIAEYLCRSINH